jgi:uncharacterized protein YodC (DUF2158 family)
MNTLTIGDVVQLKSGGPQMTICTIDEVNNTYKCCWFNGRKVEKSEFPLDALNIKEETEIYDEYEIYGY